MRHVVSMVGVGAILLACGCSNSKWGMIRAPQPTASVPASEPITAERLVANLNRNAQQLRTLECQDLELDCRQRHQPIGLLGWMVCQQPRSFRLAAKVAGSQVVDLGSNDQEFWYWISKAEPPYLFHCSYEDLARGQARMPFPFQPEWILEAMGMAEHNPVSATVQMHPTTVELIEQGASSQGQPVRKITVFSRTPSGLQVRDFIVQDAATGKEICAANIAEWQQVNGLAVPKRVRFQWPAEQIELKLKLGEVTVNRPLEGERMARLFTRPNMANVQSYDLARGLDAGAGPVQRAGAVAR